MQELCEKVGKNYNALLMLGLQRTHGFCYVEPQQSTS